ncbi:integral membrane protein [Neisseria meningitidis]|nr:integral membrane protein [Neisseria meningitidis]
MRPFCVGATVLAILGALVFFISPGVVVLHRQIFLELMLPAAYGGFLTAALLDWTGFSGNLKPATTLMAVLLLVAAVLLPFLPQLAAFFVAAYWLVYCCSALG